MYVNTVGTLGISSASSYWSRIAGAMGVSHSIWLVTHRRLGTSWSPMTVTSRLEARIAGSQPFPSSFYAQSQECRCYGQDGRG